MDRLPSGPALHIRLPLHRLLLPLQKLARRLRLRPPHQHPRQQQPPGPRRRSPPLERADRSRELG